MTVHSETAFEVVFLERLQRLLAEGNFTATYKFAVLLALVELSVEALPGTDSFTTRQLAEKVAALYWPQVLPFDELRLRHSGQRAGIVEAVETFREAVGREGGAALLSTAQKLRPAGWEGMVRTVERILIRMPLPRLQELPSGRDEFLYKITWTLRDVTEPGSGLGRAVAAYQRAAPGPFDNRILMGPGVVVALARFQGLVRELVTARWVRKVRDLNGEQLRERDLHDHLFGFRREALAALAEPLLALHDRRCFYCGRNLQVAQVDHFLPWARYPDNRLLNLVPADADCNSSKLAHLAAIEHLDRWLMRFTDRRLRQGLATLATAKAWPEGGKETLAVSRALYGQQPEGGRLWFGRGEFRRFAKGAVAARIEAALAAGEP